MSEMRTLAIGGPRSRQKFWRLIADPPIYTHTPGAINARMPFFWKNAALPRKVAQHVALPLFGRNVQTICRYFDYVGCCLRKTRKIMPLFVALFQMFAACSKIVPLILIVCRFGALGYVYVCTYVLYIYIYIRICMCICVYIYIYICMHVYVCR